MRRSLTDRNQRLTLGILAAVIVGLLAAALWDWKQRPMGPVNAGSGVSFRISKRETRTGEECDSQYAKLPGSEILRAPAAKHHETSRALSPTALQTTLGDSKDGLIRRLPDIGDTACYEIQTGKVPSLVRGDGLSLGLATGGPSEVSRLASYKPRQARYYVAQDGIYYRVEDAEGRILYWNQVSNPDNVFIENVPYGGEHLAASELLEKAKVQASSHAIASIDFPQYTEPVTLKIWYTAYQDGGDSHFGAPAFQVTVPAAD